MLTKAQVEEYNEVGAIVVPDVLTPDEVRTLSAVTDGFVQRARGLTAHTDIYDLEDSHSAANPRVRRIQAAGSGFALAVIENCSVWAVAHEDGVFRAIE